LNGRVQDLSLALLFVLYDDAVGEAAGQADTAAAAAGGGINSQNLDDAGFAEADDADAGVGAKAHGTEHRGIAGVEAGFADLCGVAAGEAGEGFAHLFFWPGTVRRWTALGNFCRNRHGRS